MKINAKQIVISMRFLPLGFVAFLTLGLGGLHAVLKIDESDPQFYSLVLKEVTLMRQGERGVVCQTLIDRIDASTATTTIRPVTSDETTWHPNDRKGSRSFVLPLDTKVRGAERGEPTSAVLFLHPSRIDPKLSLFRLGTFVRELAQAMDLNTGAYSGDFRTREKRVIFFRNAWCDVQGFGLIEISDRIPTPEYQEAKKLGLIEASFSAFFPILDPHAL